MLCALHIMLEQLFSSASDPSTVMGLQSAVNQNLLLQDDRFYHVHAAQQILVVLDFLIAMMIRQDRDGGRMAAAEWLAFCGFYREAYNHSGTN